MNWESGEVTVGCINWANRTFAISFWSVADGEVAESIVITGEAHWAIAHYRKAAELELQMWCLRNGYDAGGDIVVEVKV